MTEVSECVKALRELHNAGWFNGRDGKSPLLTAASLLERVEWRPVSELPAENESVFVVTANGWRGIAKWSEWFGNGKFWNDGLYRLTTVTNWMPLPPGPKG